jgi:hypothetical protein
MRHPAVADEHVRKAALSHQAGRQLATDELHHRLGPPPRAGAATFRAGLQRKRRGIAAVLNP